MPRSRAIPSYRLHRQSGQAVVTLTDHRGRRHDRLLGPFGSSQSHQEYVRVLGEWEANGRRLAGRTPAPDLTVAELLAAFMKHADSHYRRPDGMPTGEPKVFALAFRRLKKLYAHMLAHEFGPLALRAVREQMIQDGISRRVINGLVNRIRHVFKWAASLEMLPASVYEAL